MLAKDVVRDKVSNKFCRINSPQILIYHPTLMLWPRREIFFKQKILVLVISYQDITLIGTYMYFDSHYKE